MSFEYEAIDVLEKAKRGGYAIGAFNAANIETLKAIVMAAAKLNSPVIIESSSGETKYFGMKNLADVVANYRDEFQIPILLNLDHAHDEQVAYEAIEAGYDLIHFDGSEMDYETNVDITARIVKAAHKKNLLVEGEMDHIQGSSSVHDQHVDEVQRLGRYTDPEKAEEFVKSTGVDTFASFIGNVHGMYATQPQLDLERLRLIKEKVGCWLSLHGGSGIPEDQVKSAVGVGIVKVNVNTEMRLAFKSALFNELKNSDELAIYKLTPPAIEAVQKVVEIKMRLFGSVGKV